MRQNITYRSTFDIITRLANRLNLIARDLKLKDVYFCHCKEHTVHGPNMALTKYKDKWLLTMGKEKHTGRLITVFRIILSKLRNDSI